MRWFGGWDSLSRAHLVDHLLQLLVGHVLAQLARDALEVAEGDLAWLGLGSGLGLGP